MTRLELVTLAGPQLQGDVYEVVLPTTEGAIAVYAHHTPLVTVVTPGVITVRRTKNDDNNAREVYATTGGIAEISGAQVRLLVDEAEHADNIIEQQVAEALEAARQLKRDAKDEIELERAQALIDREVVRLKVAALRRHGRSRTAK